MSQQLLSSAGRSSLVAVVAFLVGAAVGGAEARADLFSEEDRTYWAFQPVQEPAVPEVEDAGGWAINEIDHFILRKLRQENIEPAPLAGRSELIRRAYFDLWGLPPSPAEIDAFASDPSPDAWAKVIDKLLESPHYGEQWARHWLDLVRYAESDGYKSDDFRPNAWLYRDYVIRSFNDDKPYNRFLREQLAGDEIAPNDPEAMAGTMFLRLWIYEYNQRDVVNQWEAILNDVTDVTSDVFMGVGLQCARCHDHKFDPLLQKDYYRLRAFFEPLLPRDDVPLAEPDEWLAYQARWSKWERATAEIRAEIEELLKPYKEKAAEGAIVKLPEEMQALVRKPVQERTTREHQIAELAYRQVLYEYEHRLNGKVKGEDKERLDDLRKQLAEFDRIKPEPLPLADVATDAGPHAPPTRIPKDPEERVIAPGFLSILDAAPASVSRPPAAPNSTGRRTALAQWLADSENPLSTRVIVNRIWQYHFGQGIVATASDFGELGDPPTHPELLDWLTVQFIERGWSIKEMHRLIMQSASYRQTARREPPEVARMKDPGNRWLWRMNSRRLAAEEIRDAMLAVSGELDLAVGGPSVNTSVPRRTVYTRKMRNSKDPMLALFDVPDGYSSTSERSSTTTPTQSLLMINGDWTLERATGLAKRLLKMDLPDEGALVEAAYREVFGRVPETLERERAVAFLKQQRQLLEPNDLELMDLIAMEMPARQGTAAFLQAGNLRHRFMMTERAMLPGYDFTIEAFVQLNSVYEDASVRTIAARWDSRQDQPGWALGVTGEKSAYQPRNLILQLVGDDAETGRGGYEVVASDLHLELGKPYYVAASVRIGDTSETGIAFYVKDLSEPEGELRVARVSHQITATHQSSLPFTIGMRDHTDRHAWDGHIDDVRLSKRALGEEELLVSAAGVGESTIGFWRFEHGEGFHKDASPNGNDLKMVRVDGDQDPEQVALADLCHVLLNANEFLYVE